MRTIHIVEQVKRGVIIIVIIIIIIIIITVHLPTRQARAPNNCQAQKAQQAELRLLLNLQYNKYYNQYSNPRRVAGAAQMGYISSVSRDRCVPGNTVVRECVAMATEKLFQDFATKVSLVPIMSRRRKMTTKL